jgi:hypothetical protein
MNKAPQTVAARRPVRDRYALALNLYLVGLSVVMLLFGLRQWAVIVGLTSGAGGPFETMTTGWQIVTMHFAVVDLVAAVGLWMRVSWGKVVWVYAAVSEIVLHTAFLETFGADWPKVGFHAVTLVIFVILEFLEYRHNRA